MSMTTHPCKHYLPKTTLDPLMCCVKSDGPDGLDDCWRGESVDWASFVGAEEQPACLRLSPPTAFLRNSEKQKS